MIKSTVNVYLNLPGTTEEAFTYYQTIFGGEFSNIIRYSDVPADVSLTIPNNWNNKIYHVALPISNETYLLGCDNIGLVDTINTSTVIINNFSVAIQTTTLVELNRIFNVLSNDGTIVTPINETFFGSTWAVVTDKFGINWTLNFEHDTVTNTIIDTTIEPVLAV